MAHNPSATPLLSEVGAMKIQVHYDHDDFPEIVLAGENMEEYLLIEQLFDRLYWMDHKRLCRESGAKVDLDHAHKVLSVGVHINR